MSDYKPVPPKSPGRPKGASSRNITTVRLALNRISFNAIDEFIKAYKKLDDAQSQIDALKFLFKYVYPTLGEVQLTPQDQIDLEDEEFQTIKPANIPTEELIQQLNEKK